MWTVLKDSALPTLVYALARTSLLDRSKALGIDGVGGRPPAVSVHSTCRTMPCWIYTRRSGELAVSMARLKSRRTRSRRKFGPSEATWCTAPDAPATFEANTCRIQEWSPTA